MTAGAVALLMVAGLVTWLAWPSPQPPRARHYLSFTVCALTDADGVNGAAAPVWAGMQDASLRTHVKVEYQPVTGPSTVANAVPFLNGLVLRQCDVIIAVGAAQVGAVAAEAARFPTVRFVVVGGGANGSNVTRVPGAPAQRVRTRVRDLVVDAVGRS